MAVRELPAVNAIATTSYPDHIEDPAIFRERLALFPGGCFVLDGGAGIMGYVISHPAVFGQPPKLNRLLGAIPAQADCYYIHDLALAPAARGSGATRDIVARIGTVAARLGYARIGLVAVNESTPFWASRGFAPERSPDIVARLASYGAGSVYLSAPSAAAPA